MCGRQGLPRRGCWSKRYATRACRSSEKSAASEGVELADMHDVMTSCAHVTGSSEATLHAIACRRAFDTASARLAAGRATMSAGRPGASKDASPYSSRQSTKEWSSSLSSLNVA